MSDRPVSVIVAGARTPMGRMSGSLKGFSGSDLGGFAIKGALDKAGVKPEEVDYVIMGQVLTAGEGQLPARQAAVKGGLPMGVPSLTINKVCLSGLSAIAMADQLIRAGEFEVVVAGGQESMTNAPHLLEKSRDGYKYGNVTLRDHMDLDALSDVYTKQGMGGLTEAANSGDRFVEIEKAHPDVFNVLLQVLDDGRMDEFGQAVVLYLVNHARLNETGISDITRRLFHRQMKNFSENEQTG